jgi:hypothetical protein
LFVQQEHPFQLPELDLQLFVQGEEEEQQVLGEDLEVNMKAEEEHHLEVKVKTEEKVEKQEKL